MSQLYLTTQGASKLASLATAGQGVPLTIREFAVGSGKNVDFSTRLDRQSLVTRRYQATVDSVIQADSAKYEVFCTVPIDVGGFFIREIGLFADDGTLMWVGALPEVHKPDNTHLSAVDYRIKCVVQISNADVSLVVDTNVVVATQSWSKANFIPKSALELIFPIGYKYWTHTDENPKPKFDTLFGYETHWRKLEGVVLFATHPNKGLNLPQFYVGQVPHNPDSGDVVQGYTSHLWERYDPAFDLVRYNGQHRYGSDVFYQ